MNTPVFFLAQIFEVDMCRGKHARQGKNLLAGSQHVYVIWQEKQTQA